MAADAMSGGLKGAFSGEGHRQLGAGGSRKKSRRRELHPRPIFHNYLPHMWLRHGAGWLAGTWPGGRGTPRAGRKLASPDAGCQGGDGPGQRLNLRVECQPVRSYLGEAD